MESNDSVSNTVNRNQHHLRGGSSGGLFPGWGLADKVKENDSHFFAFRASGVEVQLGSNRRVLFPDLPPVWFRQTALRENLDPHRR